MFEDLQQRMSFEIEYHQEIGSESDRQQGQEGGRHADG